MATNEGLKRIHSYLFNIGIDLGEALMIITRVFGWQWADPKDGNDYRARGVPEDKIDYVIDFFRCNYRTRFKFFDLRLHKWMLDNCKEYKADYEYECKLNQGKPWELKIINN